MDAYACAERVADAELVRRAQNGDEDAFAMMYNTHCRKIYSLCLRMTRNTAEAEDLTQNAFLHTFRMLATFRGDSAFSTWLYHVAVNTVMLHVRKKASIYVSMNEPVTASKNSSATRTQLSESAVAGFD